MNEIRVNDSDMCDMKQRILVNTGYISPEPDLGGKEQPKRYIFLILKKNRG